MDKITKLFAFPKFGSLRGSTSASLKIGEILAIRKSFWNWGSHLFYATCWQILTDLLLKQTKLALVPDPGLTHHIVI